MDLDKPEDAGSTPAPMETFLLRVKGTHPFHIVPRSRVLSIWCHWMADVSRTTPCLVCKCRGCEEWSPRRPLSYLAVQQFKLFGERLVWARCTLEVPFSTGLVLNERLHIPTCLQRIKNRGPIFTRDFNPQSPPEKIPAWDFIAGLHRMWRLPRAAQVSLVSDDQREMVDVAFT